MGEAKFTPGPWYAEADEEFGWRGEPRESEHISIYSSCNDEDDGGLIASVALVSGEFGTPVAGWDNAHLIAAAPDLYEALSRAARMFRHYEALHRAKGTKDGDEIGFAGQPHSWTRPYRPDETSVQEDQR